MGQDGATSMAKLKYTHMVFIKANASIMNKFHFQLDLLLYFSR